MTTNDTELLLKTRVNLETRLARAARLTVAAVETHHFLVLIGVLLVTTAAACLASLDKPLWLDEYFSLHTALLPSLAAIWAYQKTTPIALDPPLYHWLSHYSLHLFGVTAFAARFVSVMFYLIFTASTFTLLRKLANTMTSLFAASFALSTGLFDFAFEARPYSLLVGAGAAALLMWYWASTETYHKLALAGLAACIAIAMSGHYFGCLVAIPIATAELVRWRIRRQITLGVVFALLAGGSSAALYLPLLAPLKQYQVKYFTGVSLRFALELYTVLFQHCLLTFAFLIVGLAVTAFSTSLVSKGDGRRILLDPATLTALVCFAALPLFGYLVAKAYAHTFVPRFALPAGIGIVLLLAMAVAWAAQGRPLILTSAVLMALLFPAMRAVPQLIHALHSHGVYGQPPLAVLTKEPDLRIVVGRLEHAFQMADQMPDSIRRRCVLLTSPSQADLVGDRTDILSTAGMQHNNTVRIDIQEYEPFVRAHPRFLILGNVFAMRQWVVRKVLQDHGDVRLEGTYGETEVFSASVPPLRSLKAQ